MIRRFALAAALAFVIGFAAGEAGVTFASPPPRPAIPAMPLGEIDRIAARLVHAEQRIAYWRGWKRLPAETRRENKP